MPDRLLPRAAPAAVAVALLCLAGCSSGKKTYPVAGRFVWAADGSPAKELAGGRVVFQCDAEQATAKGNIGPDGGFVLETFKPGDGAVAGTYKVAVVQPVADHGDNPPLQVVHRKYEDPAKTDLVATVEPKANTVELKVEPGAYMLKKRRP